MYYGMSVAVPYRLDSEVIRDRHLKQFGRIARIIPEMDHRRALRAAIKGLPAGWVRDEEENHNRHESEPLKPIYTASKCRPSRGVSWSTVSR